MWAVLEQVQAQLEAQVEPLAVAVVPVGAAVEPLLALAPGQVEAPVGLALQPVQALVVVPALHEAEGRVREVRVHY